MSTRTISITEEAYERLKISKYEKDSFSDVILRITNKRKLSDFAGILNEKEAETLKENIKELREKSRNRMEKIRKALNE